MQWWRTACRNTLLLSLLASPMPAARAHPAPPEPLISIVLEDGAWSGTFSASSARPTYQVARRKLNPGMLALYLPGTDLVILGNHLHADHRFETFILAHELSHLNDMFNGRYSVLPVADCLQHPERYAFDHDIQGLDTAYVCQETEVRARRYAQLYREICGDRSGPLGVPGGAPCPEAPDPTTMPTPGLASSP
ncbi:hypothetical protein HNR42_003343 [Deinobacterium chartae]|uniref:Uncharacterized protein n=1 Tax=Deinobacterium chartae TaxID=521158 RepID=A0A841I3K0_9DEIO|nr:hypothetical protein [Deinobacterium chartae]MBB6099883.1 hypothetical protein [Deinobacterium chartae]